MTDLKPWLERAISRAEQACRYASKHNSATGFDSDFHVACKVCEDAISP